MNNDRLLFHYLAQRHVGAVTSGHIRVTLLLTEQMLTISLKQHIRVLM